MELLSKFILPTLSIAIGIVVLCIFVYVAILSMAINRTDKQIKIVIVGKVICAIWFVVHILTTFPSSKFWYYLPAFLLVYFLNLKSDLEKLSKNKKTS